MKRQISPRKSFLHRVRDNEQNQQEADDNFAYQAHADHVLGFADEPDSAPKTAAPVKPATGSREDYHREIRAGKLANVLDLASWTKRSYCAVSVLIDRSKDILYSRIVGMNVAGMVACEVCTVG